MPRRVPQRLLRDAEECHRSFVGPRHVRVLRHDAHAHAMQPLDFQAMSLERRP